jgi:hypothetical protein
VVQELQTAVILLAITYEELFKLKFNPIGKFGFGLKLGREPEPTNAGCLSLDSTRLLSVPTETLINSIQN